MTTQEKDQLDMSKKKTKVVREGSPSSRVNPREAVPVQPIKFQTTLCMSLDRKVVSYKDICLGQPSAEEGSDDHSAFLGDPFCLVVKLTNAERDIIRIPWKRAILVKVLGKHMSLRYFHARLIKLWRPIGRIEAKTNEADNHDQEPSTQQRPTAGEQAEGDSFGPWMIAQKPQRRNHRNQAEGAGTDQPVSNVKGANHGNQKRSKGKGKAASSIIHNGPHVCDSSGATPSDMAIRGNLEDNAEDGVEGRLLGPLLDHRGQEKYIGPVKTNRLKMGLNLKSLVKQAARRSGPRSTLDLSGLYDSTSCVNSFLSGNGPPGGLGGWGDVFNNRPPDSVQIQSFPTTDGLCMNNVGDQGDVEILDAAQVQGEVVPPPKSS
ncbi:hypothetical protein SESBI_40556 [Sesbania bispinosa]|nr:hypothetical protein SESBI_40556 [Sesbania bispinosa]